MKKELISISLVVSIICMSSTDAAERRQIMTQMNNGERPNMFGVKQTTVEDLSHVQQKQPLDNISILEHAILLTNAHAHDPTEYFNYSNELLKNKIFTSLTQTIEQLTPTIDQDEFLPRKKMDWFDERDRLPLKAKEILENIIRTIIRPGSTRKVVKPDYIVLFEWDFIEQVREVCLNADKTKITILFEDGRGEIRNAKNGKMLFNESGLEDIRLDSSDTMVELYYENGQGKIIRLKDEELLFEGTDVEDMDLESAASKIIVTHTNYSEIEIINLKNGNLFTYSAEQIIVGLDGTSALLYYNNDQVKLIDLNNEDQDILFEYDDVQSVFFDSNSTNFEIRYKDGKKEIRDLNKGKELWTGDSTDSVYLNSDGTRVVVWDKDDNVKIINLNNKDKDILFEQSDITSVTLNSIKTIAEFLNEDSKIEIVRLEDGRVLFGPYDADSAYLNADDTRIAILDKKGRGKIINLENEEIIFEENENYIINLRLSLAKTKAIISYDGQKGKEIINFKDGEPLFKEDNNTLWMSCSSDDKRLIVHYMNGKGKIINLKNEEIIFEENNIRKISISKTKKKAKIYYKYGRKEIRNLEDGELLFQGDDNVQKMSLSSDETTLTVKYKNGKIEIRNLEGYNQGIVFTGLNQEQLLFMFLLRNFPFSSNNY